MAQTDHLPIYKSSYDLCLYLEQVVARFSRTHRYSLGAELREGARRVLRLVVRANARRDKVPVLLELREELEDLKVLVRLGHDTKAFARLCPVARAHGRGGRRQRGLMLSTVQPHYLSRTGRVQVPTRGDFPFAPLA